MKHLLSLLKLNLKTKVSLALAFLAAMTFAFTLKAQNDDFRRLEDSIANLKSKIRTSTNKDPKDIQKLSKLENELEKKQYLQKHKPQ